MLQSKNSNLKLIKNKKEVAFIASLVLNILKTEKKKFLLLKGEIGSGKTFLVKEIAKQLNEQNTITSPTFNKMHIYDKFVHIDAYNLKNSTLESFEDYFEDKIVIIEWPEMLKTKFNQSLVLEIKFVNDDLRSYTISFKD